MRAVAFFLLVFTASVSVARETDPEIEFGVYPEWSLVEYTNYWTGEYINIADLTGHWQVMEIQEGVDLTDPNERPYIAVTLAPVPDKMTGLPMIELDGNNLTPEELDEVLDEAN